MVNPAQVKLISNHTFKGVLKSPINRWLIGGFLVLIAIALSSSFLSNVQHQHDVDHYSSDVRERWESNPDKHPHRMSHYGYVAFRSKAPLSFFDRGLDSYLGNVMFLEAHRQNSVNFSNASQSSGLLRFGELSAGLLLQLLLPLLIFFWGFASVSDDRGNGILKLYFTQGVSWKEVMLGKFFGIFGVSLLILVPVVVMTTMLLLIQHHDLSYPWFSLLGISTGYLTYLMIMSVLSVWVSAKSSSSKSALIVLIGFWIFFVLIIPKLTQVGAQVMFPSPSKIEFDSVVEHELIKHGDSHNPDDPHFKAIKDSVLLANNVSSTKDLPFNYGGFIMKEGERLSTEIYRKHEGELINIYRKQSEFVKNTALFNPYIAIKTISMVLSGTDFGSYQLFKNEAETYRYELAQTMNNLQIEHISNATTSSADKKATISQQYWKNLPDFEHRFLSRAEMFRSIRYAVLSLALWLFVLVFGVVFLSKNLKAI